MKALRTPDERFADLPDYPFDPHYVEVDGLRMHHLDEGPADGPTVVLLHGQPSWSYLYRAFIPPLVASGHRVIALDLVGFGRSDKPVDEAAYTYASHTAWVRAALFDVLGLKDIHLFCQDWGGLIGLRLVGLHPERFATVCAANTGLPAGHRMPPAFAEWKAFNRTVPDLPVGALISRASGRDLTADEIAAYDAPFPDVSYKAGVRMFPDLVPDGPDYAGVAENKKAWGGLLGFDRPFLTLFSDGDPITGGGEKAFIGRVPGAAGQPHRIVPGGHFLQEDCADTLVEGIRHLTGR